MKIVGKAVLAKGTKDEMWGLCKSQSVKHEADKEVIKNGDGDTVGIIYTDIRQAVTGEYTPYASAAETDIVKKEDIIGEELEVTMPNGQTISIHIDDAEMRFESGKAMTFTFNGYYYPKVVGDANV